MILVRDTWLVDPDKGIIYGRGGRPIGVKHGKYLRVDGKSRGLGRIMAHRLVWEAVHGPIPEGLEPNHRNGIGTDNRISNLELVTRQQNVLHAFAIGLRSNAGEQHPAHRLRDGDIREIRRRVSIGERTVRLAEDYGVTHKMIRLIVRREAWAHVSEEAVP